MFDSNLSFSVLITVGLLIRGGMKGAMIEASTRVIGMSVGKVACSIASLSIVSQKSSTCTSSETENSGQVNCGQSEMCVNMQRGQYSMEHVGKTHTHRSCSQAYFLQVLHVLHYFSQNFTSTFFSSSTLLEYRCAISSLGVTPQMPQIMSL